MNKTNTQLFVTQTESLTGQQIVRPASSYSDAVRILFDSIDTLKSQGIRVWGSLRDGFQTVIEGELITFSIE